MKNSLHSESESPVRDKNWALNNRRNFFKQFTREKKATKKIDNGEYWNGALWVRERFLGKGRFGSVFLVKRKYPINGGTEVTDLPSEMAVKRASIAEAATLKYEKQIFSLLKESQYVVKCYGDMETEEGESEKIYNLFLEFCSGGSLYDYIKKGCFKGFLEEEVKSFTRDIVRGLQFIHSNLIVHCDIKPDNILIAPGSDGRLIAKLADFGLAKNLDYEEWEEISYIGTYRYMSPEMVKDKILACPTDIWALGCVVIEMLSGKPGWEYVTKEELFEHIGYTSELPSFPRNVSENARDFLSKCLIRDFEDRWTAEELLQHPFLSVDALSFGYVENSLN